jgi:LacI family transcriptional regulator, galactose operon repressor
VTPTGDGRTTGDHLTIRDVARDAGVSVATVSRVLAGSARVSPALAERVRESVRRLGYTPHSVARSLASGRTRLVGALVPNLANHYFYALIKRMLHDAERDGYRLIVADSDENVVAERELGLNLLHQTDGLILCSPRARASVVRQLLDHGKPVLVLNRLVDGLPVSQVVVESYPAMRQVAAHVAELGHRRVAYLQGPVRSWHSKERWRAVRSLARGGLDITAIRVGATMEAGHRAVPQILRSGVTAVLAYNDLAAIGVVVGLAERGIRVPDEISVTGFDDIPYSRFVTPPLTTVHSPQEEVGSVAWKTMTGLLHGEHPGTRTVLAAEPVIRGSTAPPPGNRR